MSRLASHLISGLTGRVCAAIATLIVIPLYIHFLGVEAYGLVGFFAVLLGVSNLLDMGLSATLNRDLARYSAQPRLDQEVRDVVMTVQILYWMGGVLLCLMVVALSGPIAQHWVNPSALPVQMVERSVMLMGFALAVQWPIALYSGGLMGLQRQVLANGLNAALVTFRSFGALLVLWIVSPSILAFFIWQGLASLLGLAVIGRALWNSLPPKVRGARFRLPLLRSLWRFAAGMSANTILAVALNQLDKLILTRLLPLETFGYYTLAISLAGGLTYLSSPVFSAIFPGLSQTVAIGDTKHLAGLYHRGCQAMTVILVPATILLVLFAPEIVLSWTRSPLLTHNTHILVSLSAISTGLNGVASVPFALTLAYGWTKLSLLTNGVALVLLAPLTVFMTLRFGAVGATIVPVILNAGYILVFVQLMHRRLLYGEKWRWYVQDLGVPALAAFLVLGLGRFLLKGGGNDTWTPLWLLAVWAVAVVAACLSASQVWQWLKLQMASALKVPRG